MKEEGLLVAREKGVPVLSVVYCNFQHYIFQHDQKFKAYFHIRLREEAQGCKKWETSFADISKTSSTGTIFSDRF